MKSQKSVGASEASEQDSEMKKKSKSSFVAEVSKSIITPTE